jgi:hypothetical protein
MNDVKTSWACLGYSHYVDFTDAAHHIPPLFEFELWLIYISRLRNHLVRHKCMRSLNIHNTHRGLLKLSSRNSSLNRLIVASIASMIAGLYAPCSPFLWSVLASASRSWLSSGRQISDPAVVMSEVRAITARVKNMYGDHIAAQGNSKIVSRSQTTISETDDNRSTSIVTRR